MPDLDTIRRARIYLARVAEPPAPALARFIAQQGPVDAAERVRAGDVPDDVAAETRGRHRSAQVYDADFGDPARGIHLVIPEDTGTWPTAALNALHHTGSDTDQPSGAPLALWIRSDLGIAELPHLLTDNVALLGARAASGYGEHVAAQFGYDLAMQGICVASGAGYGVEGAGLRGALTYGTGRTVAVLGAGIDQDYPHGHRGLLTSVAAQGAVISEYPPGASPARARFLASRRILAAVSSVVVIVEAGVRGGNRATARIAHTLGRTVMAVPGPITSATSRGTNQMLHDLAAIAVTSIHDVLDAHREAALPVITPDRAPAESPVRVVATRMPHSDQAPADVVDGELVD